MSIAVLEYPWTLTLTRSISMNIYIPYTYYIRWTKIDKHYYGVRYAKNCHPSDLWSKYFTSSKIVKEYRQKYGEPDVIEVRKTFNCGHKAKIWETKVLRKMNVLRSNKWLNANIGGDQIFVLEHSSYTKLKMSQNNFSKTKQGRKIIQERQTGSLNSFYGKHHTDEAKRIKSEKNKGYYWWTNGQANIKSKTCPSGFYRGKSNIKRNSLGMFKS